MIQIEDPNAAEYVIDELKKWTEYRVWMLAGTIVGDGPSSYPVLVRTGEDGRFLNFFLSDLKKAKTSSPLSVMVLVSEKNFAFNGPKVFQRKLTKIGCVEGENNPCCW